MALGHINEEVRYAKRSIRLNFSFRTKAGADPDAIRDMTSGIVKSVTRSGGVYTVTFKPNFPLPLQTTSCQATLRGSATPTKFCTVEEVTGSYDPVARTIQFAVINLTTGAQGVAEPDDQTWVSVQLLGPAAPAFKDAV